MAIDDTLIDWRMKMAGLDLDLSFDEIEKVIEKYISDLGDKLDHIEITWAESEYKYYLWINPVPANGVFVTPKDGRNWGAVTVAWISKYKDGDIWPEALDLVRAAGRKLYFDLRKSYPVKRDLGLR